MSKSNVQYLYLDDVRIIDDLSSVDIDTRPTRDGSKDYYCFRVEVSDSDYKRLKLAIADYIQSLGGEDWSFTPNPMDGRCFEEQQFMAYLERFNGDRHKVCSVLQPGGYALDYRPRDCTLSCPELRQVYFKQFDLPKVSGHTHNEYENLNGRTGQIKMHLVDQYNGQIYAYADYIDLKPEPDDGYVPTGNDDGGLF